MKKKPAKTIQQKHELASKSLTIVCLGEGLTSMANKAAAKVHMVPLHWLEASFRLFSSEYHKILEHFR